MKKARSQKLKKFNKVLSVLLAAAMVAGSVPDVSLVAHATEAETEAVEETNFLSEENVDAADAVSESISEEVSTAEEQQPSEEAVPTEEEVSEEAVSTQEASSTEENKESEPTSDAVETESVNVSEDNTAGEEEVIADESIAPEAAEGENEENPEDTATTTVTIEPETATVEKGGTQEFTATVTIPSTDGSESGGTEASRTGETVTWTIETEGKLDDTTIESEGTITNNTSTATLKVSSEETAETLTIKAAVGDASGTATVTVKEPEVPDTRPSITLSADSNEALSEQIEYAISDKQTARPDQLSGYKKFAEGDKTDAGNYIYVKVPNVDAAITVSGAVECYGDDKYLYYECHVTNSVTIAVTAKVNVIVTPDSSSRVKNIEIAEYTEPEEPGQTAQVLSLERAGKALTTDDADYGKAYNIVVTAGDEAVITGISVNSEKKTAIEHDNAAKTYTVENAFTANGQVDVQLKSAKAAEVKFQENDGTDNSSSLAVEYAFNKEMTVKNTVSNKEINFAGELYFEPTVGDKKILKVVAVNYDQDGDETDEVEVSEATDGIYKITVSEKTLIKVITKEQHAVTVTLNEDKKSNIASYSWARSKDAPAAEWTKVVTPTETPGTRADETGEIFVTNGESIFFRVELAKDVQERATVSVGGSELDPLDMSPETFEVNVKSATTVTIGTAAAHDTTEQEVAIQLSGSSVQAENIASIKYRVSGVTNWTELPKTGTPTTSTTAKADEKVYDFTADKLKVLLGKYYEIEITLDAETAETAFVKTIGGMDAVNNGAAGTAKVRITSSVGNLPITFGAVSGVELSRPANIADTLDSVKYWIGDGSEQTATFNTETNKAKITAKEGETVSFTVTPKAGYKAIVKNSSDSMENPDKDGVYQVTVDATEATFTITTEASADITFAVKDGEGAFQRGIVDEVEYQLVESNGTVQNDWEKITIPKKLKEEPSETITLTETEGKDLYFKVTLVNDVDAAVKEVKNGSDPIEPVENEVYYKIPNAAIKDGTEIDIVTVAEYTITVDKTGLTSATEVTLAKGENESDDIAAEATTELKINAGESYQFTLSYKKEKAKVDTVSYTNTEEEEPDENALKIESATDDTTKVTTETYTLKPSASGKLTLAAHDKAAVTVNVAVDDNNTKIKAAKTKEELETATALTATDKAIAVSNIVNEDDTLYFSVESPARYTVAKVEYETAEEDEDGDKVWEVLEAENNIYTLPLTDIIGTQAVRITTVRDAAKNNEVVFDADLAGVEIGIVTGTVVDADNNKVLLGSPEARESIGKAAYTEAASLDFTVKTKAGYFVNNITIDDEVVTKIEVNGVQTDIDEVDFSTARTLKVEGLEANLAEDGSNKASKTVKIGLVKKVYDKDVFFKVVSNESGVYADVTTNDKIQKIVREYSEAVYKAAKGAEETEIKVQVPTGSQAPSLTLGQGGPTVSPISGPSAIAGTGREEYTFTVVLGKVSDLDSSSSNNPTQITVSTSGAVSSEPKYNADITVNRAVEDVAVTVRLMKDDTTKVSLNPEYTEETVTYTTGDEENKILYENGTYVLYAEIAQNHELTSDIPGFSFYKTEKGRNVYRAYITGLKGDIVGTITSKANIIFTVKKALGGEGTASEVAPVNNVYAAAKNDVFEVTFQSGSKNGVFTGDKAKVSGITIAEDDTKTLVASDNKITFTVPGDAKKGKVTLTVFYGEGEQKDFTFEIADTIKSLKITGTGVKNNAVTQKLDTTAVYQVTGVKDFSTLHVESKAAETKDGITGAEMVVSQIDDKGKFTVTASKAANQASIITITSTAEKVAKEEGSTELVAKELAVLTVTTAAENLEIKSVTQKAVLDNSVVLTASPKDAKLQKPATFGLMYKVEVAQETGTGAPTLTNKPVQYFPVVFDSNGKVQPTDMKVMLTDGIGKAWKYTLKVTLVEGEIEGNAIKGEPVVKSETVKELAVTTKDPYYEEKLSLTKKTTTVYTGQENVVVAIPKFGKNTTYQDEPVYGGSVQIFDKNGFEVTNNGFIDAWWDEDTNEIKVSVSRNYWNNNTDQYVSRYGNTDIMAYTLKVVPDAGKKNGNTTVDDNTTTNMYAAPATLKITVAQGIEKLSANGGDTVSDARKIYKQSGKAASYNMDLKYNDGGASKVYYKPKAAKVEFTLGTISAYGQFIEADEALKKLITVKNGKISINKAYAVSSDARENVFAVRVKAVDYAGNTTETLETYEVTGQAATLGSIYFTNYEDGKYYVIPKDAKGVTVMTMDQLVNARPIVLRTGVAEGQKYYTYEDILKVNTDYTISYNTTKIGKNQTITAAVTDGSKTKKVTAKYTVNYNTEKLGISGFNVSDSENYVAVLPTGTNAKGAYTYEFQSNSVDDTVVFWVGYEKDGVLTSQIDRYKKFNYSVSVSGGTILNSKKTESYDYGYYKVLPNKKDMTITLTDKGTSKAVKTTYVLTNKGFVTTAAPKVAVKNNSFYAGLGSNVELTITKNGKYDAMYLSADQKEYEKSKSEIQSSYSAMDRLNNIISLDRTAASETIRLSASQSAAATYKYNVTFGTTNADGEFVPQTKAVAIKVTVKAKAAYKPAAKYTIDQKVGYVALSGSPADYTYTAYGSTKVENANVKGQPNNFDKFFKIDTIGYNTKVLRMYDSVKIGDTTYDTPEKISEYLATKEGKNDLTGYVYYENPKTNTTEAAKITVSLKDNKYTAAPISHILDSNKNLTDAATTVKNGKEDVKVLAAYIKNEEDGTVFTAKADSSNKVLVSTTAEPGKAAYNKTIMYVVPVGSSHAEVFAEGKNPTAADFEKYGVPTALKITIANPKKGKIVFKDKKVLTQVITEEEYETNVTTRTEVDKANLYKQYVNFDVLPGAKVTKIALEKPEEAPYLTISKVPDVTVDSVETIHNTVLITVDKDKLIAAQKANTSKKSLYGAKKAYKATVEFAQGDSETISFNITMPTPQEYAEALAAVQAAEEKIEALTYGYSTMSIVANRVVQDVTKEVKPSSGAVVVPTIDNVNSKAPTDEEDGYINVALTISDTNYYATEAEKQPDYTSVMHQAKLTKGEIRIVTLTQADNAIVSALDAKYGTDDGINKATANVSASEVYSVAKGALDAADYCDPRFEVRVTKCDITQPTDKAPGTLQINVRVSRSIWERKNVSKNYTISQLTTWSGVVSEVKAALEDEDLVLGNDVTADQIKAIAQKVIGDNKAITVDFGVKETTAEDGSVTPVNEHFQFEEAQHASEGKDGYVLGTLIFTYTTKEILPSGKEKTKTETKKLTFVSAATQNNAEAYVKVKAFDTKATAKTSITSYFNSSTFTTTEDLSAAAKDIVSAAQKQIYSPDGSITVAIAKKTVDGKEVDDIEVTTQPSFSAAGEITAKLDVTKKDDATPESVTIKVAIAKKTQTLKEAEDAAKKVLDAFTYTASTTAANIKTELDKVLAKPATINAEDFKIADGKLTAKILITSSTGAQKYISIEKSVATAETPAE